MVGKIMEEIAFYANSCTYGYLLMCKYYCHCPCLKFILHKALLSPAPTYFLDIFSNSFSFFHCALSIFTSLFQELTVGFCKELIKRLELCLLLYLWLERMLFSNFSKSELHLL